MNASHALNAQLIVALLFIRLIVFRNGRSVKYDHSIHSSLLTPNYSLLYMKLLITLLLTLFSSSLYAQDYVDAINEASQAQEGKRVVYEMNIGSFTPQGTLQAAQQQLPTLKRLGVDVVWLMPIYPRGGGINSPYAAKNFQQVNPSYGSVADLKAFVARAHELQMLVWLDWVPNHTATDADWVRSHPDYYTQRNGAMVHPNNYGDVYELNYGNTALVAAMNDCLKFWIDQADVDGYRCDYISSPTIPASYWQTTIPLIKSYKAGKTITFLGEADIVNDATRLKSAFANNLISSSSAVNFGRMLYVTNHDQNWNEEKKTLTQKYGDNRYALRVLTYTLFGMPLIYNGEETGGNQGLNYFEDTRIDWNTNDAKMFNTLRTLGALKHLVPALADTKEGSQNPSVDWVNIGNATSCPGVLAFTRKQGDSEVLVLLNVGSSAANATLTGLSSGAWSLWLDSETIAQGVSRKQMNLNATTVLSIPAKGYKVYVKGTYSEEELHEQPQPEAYTPTLESDSEISIFFETSTSSSYAAWVWGDLGGGEAYCSNASWPGDELELKGQTVTGNYIYKYCATKVAEIPFYLIISKNSGNTKIYDGVSFVNHGYYVEGQSSPTQIITLTSAIPYLSSDNPSLIHETYDLSGRRLSSPSSRGFYIQNGKKFWVFTGMT